MIVNEFMLSGSAVMTRVRLARNLVGYPFDVADKISQRKIIESVYNSVRGEDDLKLVYLSNLSPFQLEALRERHIISSKLIDNKDKSACIISDDESLSIMVHEEDLIREQCFLKGLHIFEAYKKLEQIDDVLSRKLDFAFDNRLGYLTACPTNLGTGLRASVMLFLPALTESGEIKNLVDAVKEYGFTVRGLYGEGSKSEGYMYQVSNEVTLGVTEQKILTTANDIVLKILKAEREQAEKFFQKNKLQIMDSALKSYGLLTNSILLSTSEFLSRISDVKFGAMLGVLNIDNIDAIDDLIVSVRPANLCMLKGKKLSLTDRDLLRAKIVGEKLRELKG